MTMPAISAITSALPTTSTSALSGLGSTDTTTPSATSGDFASMLSKGTNAVESTQDKADGLAVKAATGDLTDIHDYTIAATQASLVTELATTLRTKGVDAFNQIMGMQA